MENYNHNPKKLDLDVLEHQTGKVTLGFKIDPKEKLALAREAEDHCISLSKYVEDIVLQRAQIISSSHESYALQATIDELKKKLNFYENDSLKQLFNAYNGQAITFRDTNGKTQTITVNEIKDVFTIMINSFIPAKK